MATILRNTTIQFTDDYDGSSTLAMSGDIVSTELGGSFNVTTNPGLSSGPDDYPTFGVIRFTGIN